MHDAILFVIPVFTISMLLEWFFAVRKGNQTYERWDSFASLSMGVGSVVVGFGYDVLLAGAVTLVSSVVPWKLDPHVWWTWPIALVVFDLCMYWSHRLHHEVRMLWAAHVNHHSSQHYNLSTALRQSWTEGFTGIPMFALSGLAGLSVEHVMLSYAINLLYQFFTHTELVGRLGPLEWVFNTPSHHRVHHGSNLEYLDRNYGGMLIVWDRLFGTFEPETVRAEYGLTTNIRSFNPFVVAFHEWAAMAGDVFRARSLKHALKYMFARPGWSPDGSSMTVPEARRAAGLDAAE